MDGQRRVCASSLALCRRSRRRQPSWAEWLRCPPEPRPASSAQGRPSKRQASVRARAATCSFDLRLGRVCRCASRRMSACASQRKPSAAEKSHMLRVVSGRHAARPPSASIWTSRCPIDAPRRRASKARQVRHGIARRIRARHPSRMRVCIRKSSYCMEQLINQAINQQERNDSSWHPAADTNH